MPASLFMSVAVNMFRVASKQQLPPAEIATRLNGVLADYNENMMFVTMFIGVADLKTGRLEYTIGFGTPSQGSNTLVNANGAIVWTYSDTGTVGNFGYSADADGLYFYLSPSDVAESSLTLTSAQTFSGTMNSVKVTCGDAYGMEIKAYAGQTEWFFCNLVEHL